MRAKFEIAFVVFVRCLSIHDTNNCFRESSKNYCLRTLYTFEIIGLHHTVCSSTRIDIMPQQYIKSDPLFDDDMQAKVWDTHNAGRARYYYTHQYKDTANIYSTCQPFLHYPAQLLDPYIQQTRLGAYDAHSMQARTDVHTCTRHGQVGYILFNASHSLGTIHWLTLWFAQGYPPKIRRGVLVAGELCPLGKHHHSLTQNWKQTDTWINLHWGVPTSVLVPHHGLKKLPKEP